MLKPGWPMSRSIFVAGVLLLAVVARSAADEAPAPAAQGEPGGLWDRTLEYAGATLAQARRLWQEQHPEDAQLWDELLPRLDEILTLHDRQPALPESAWFTTDQASNAARIDQLLDEAAGILVGDDRERANLRELSRAIADNLQAIGELKRRRITAPSDSLWRQTVQDIDAEIAERERVLAEQRQALAQAHADAALRLREIGLDIDAEGLEYLLSTVVGDDVVDMAVAFEQVRRLTKQLETLTAESGEDLASARRYYGMYTVLLRIVDHMHDALIEAIDDDYLPRIDRIAERAGDLRAETQALQRNQPSAVLAANLEAQQLTIDATARYAEFLERQRAEVAAARKRLARDLAVAQNTYETVKVSGDLVALMRDSRPLLDSLFRLQVPPLRTFENLEMKREFQRLTTELRAAETV
jgi:hypothetical protein